nr:unnamed protein product [Spirometra erinaceieuropaei]
MAVVRALTGNFTGPDDLNLIIVKNTCVEVFDVTVEGLKQLRDVPVNAKIVSALLFRRKGQKSDSLFLLTGNAEVAIIECTRTDSTIEFTTVSSGSIADRSARMIDQGIDALVDPEASYIVIRLYHGLLNVIPLRSLGDRANASDLLEGGHSALRAHSVRIEEGNIVDMAFLHGYSLPTFSLIYEDEVVLHMKTYEIFGREPAFRSVPPTLDSIEPDSKLLIPVPAPYGGLILAGDNIICYHAKDGPHISQYIPQTKASQVLCYAQVDAKRYLLGDMAGRLYMIHLLLDEPTSTAGSSSLVQSQNSTTAGSHRIGSIRIELLGETVIPESIVYLDNGVVFVATFLGDSQLIRLNPDLESERNSYITVLEQITNIGPIVDMVLLESKGQNQLITCSGAYKEGSLRIIRSGIGIQEHASIDQEQIKGVWCFPFESPSVDDSIVVSMVGQTQLLRLSDDDIVALHLEGFKTDEQTVYCAILTPSTGVNPGTDAAAGATSTPHPLLLQATTSGLRLIGIQQLLGRGCLSTWTPPTGRSVSCLSSYGNLIVVASGPDIYTLRVTETTAAPAFTELGHKVLPHEVACIDMSPFDRTKLLAANQLRSPRSQLQSPQSVSMHSADENLETLFCSEPQYAAVGLWMGHGLALLQLPSLEVVHLEPLPETTASTGTAVLPRSILISQLNDTAFLFAAMGDGALYYYTIDFNAENIVLRDAKRVNAGTGPSMYLSQWRSHNKNNVFVCSNHPCIVYSVKNKLVFANVNLKEVGWMCPLNGSYYKDCICLVTPGGLILGSVDEIQKLHVRSIPLEETPRRLALQSETGSLGVICNRQEVFQEGVGFKAVRSSASLSTKVPKTHSSVPKTVPSCVSTTMPKFRDIEVSSLLIYNQANLELQFAHTFYFSNSLLETAISIASINLEAKNTVVYAVGTALIVKGEYEPTKGRIHLFRWDPENSRLETLLVHDVNGAVYRIIDFNGRILAGISSSVRLFDVKDDSLRLASSFNENITVLFLRSKGDFVLIGDLMRSLTLLLYKSNMNNFETVGRHRCPRWTTSVEILDDEHFLAAETEGNIFVVARDAPENTKEPRLACLLEPPTPVARSTFQGHSASAAATSTTAAGAAGAGSATAAAARGDTVSGDSSSDVPTSAARIGRSRTEHPMGPGTGSEEGSVSSVSEMRTLVDCAYMHSGDFINTFVRGNLVLQNSEEKWQATGDSPILYGTAQGGLGLLTQISPVLFAFLKEVESRIANLIVPVGGFAHENWRAFKADKVIRMAHNFVDGDLVETVLDLNAEEKAKLVEGLRIPATMALFGSAGSSMGAEPETRPCTVEDLVKVVEEMASLH